MEGARPDHRRSYVGPCRMVFQARRHFTLTPTPRSTTIQSSESMHVRDLEHWLKAKPFEPFSMLLSNGDTVKVNHPDAAVPGTNAVLVIEKRNGRLQRFSHVSLFHVIRIEPANGAARKSPRRN